MVIIKRPVRMLLTTLLVTILAGGQSAYGEAENNVVYFLIDTTATKNGKSLIKNFYYHDIALHGHPIHFSTDSFRLEVDRPFLLLQANEKQNPYLIFPGETIHVNFLESGEAYMFIPGNSQRTNELNFFTRLVQQTGNLSYAFKLAAFLKKVSSLNELKQCETQINQIKQARLIFLTQYANTHPVGSEFISTATNSINSVALNDSIELYAINSKYLESTGVFKKKMDEKKAAVTQIQLQYLRYPLQSAASLVNVLASGNSRYLSYGLKDLDNQYQAINEHFTGKYKEYLLFKVIVDAASHYITIPPSYLQHFYETCKDSTYLSFIAAKLKETKDIAVDSEDALIDEAGQRSNLADVLKRYSGHVVLLDFWASWCAPCREEMKHSKTLEKKFNGKPVTFIYLSIDENKQAWLDANKKEQLQRNSFLLLSPDRTRILQSNQVVGIPKYMLINKAGKVITDDAPRPSDPLLLTLIEKNL